LSQPRAQQQTQKRKTARSPTAATIAAKRADSSAKNKGKSGLKTVPAARKRVAKQLSQPSALPSTSSPPEAGQPLANIARQLRSWSDTAKSLRSLVGPVADLSLKLAASGIKASAKPGTILKAGTMLKQAREAAGLTVQEVAKAVNLGDATLLERAEGGKVDLPFEVILRLASVFGRHDPVSFVMKVTRSYNPELWQTMEKLGVGKLAVHAGREREFLNIYRASDEARHLSDEEFATVLSFASAAFEMALAFRRTINTAQVAHSKATTSKKTKS
jgi:transcriptional regulator with XRE-family HTH domain